MNNKETWINWKQWAEDRGIALIDSELNSKEVQLTDEEYYSQQRSIREIIELNMVMYGKW
jgi:hypothetical protein